MSENLSSQEIAQALHPVFDQQIINYGAYNLVFARGTAIYRNEDIAKLQQPHQEYFLIGYRDAPREMVIAPLALPDMIALGPATSIDNTNALSAYILNENTFGIESTNGSSFVLSLAPSMEVETPIGRGILDQETDLEDFERFLSESWII